VCESFLGFCVVEARATLPVAAATPGVVVVVAAVAVVRAACD
jgi:hypothetical protein